MLKQSSFVKEWMQDSWEKGRQDGWKEGQKEGQIEIILKLLTKVLGRISPELEAKIHSLSDTEIERLIDDLFSMKKTTDLEEWFRVRRENSEN